MTARAPSRVRWPTQAGNDPPGDTTENQALGWLPFGTRMAIAGALVLGLSARGEQGARELEHLCRPVLEAELELVKRTCGSLTPDARRQIVAAGGEAVTSTARQYATWQRGKQTTSFDPRESIHEAVATAVAPHAAPEEFAAYGREHLARKSRRERAARLFIIARLDQELGLTVAQRDAIAADLEQRWEPGWTRQLDDDGSVHRNGRGPAPDFADACVAPHLDDRQRAAWTHWCRDASWSHFVGAHMNTDGNSLEPDPWWAP